jgi:hypothetical protein
LRDRRALIAEMVAGTNRVRRRGSIDPIWAGKTLLALEDGFRLHRLIDPQSTPVDAFLRTVAELQRLVGGDDGLPSKSQWRATLHSGERLERAEAV